MVRHKHTEMRMYPHRFPSNRRNRTRGGAMLGGTKVGQEAEEVKGKQGQEPLSFCRKDKTKQDKQAED